MVDEVLISEGFLEESNNELSDSNIMMALDESDDG